MKSSENSFETPKGCLSCSIRLGNNLFPNWEQKNEKKSDFFRKCRIDPKNVKGGTLWDLLTYILLQNIKKLEGGPLGDISKFSKKLHSAEKLRGTL